MAKSNATTEAPDDLDLFDVEAPKGTSIERDMQRAVETMTVELPATKTDDDQSHPLVQLLDSPLPRGVTKTRKGAGGAELEYLEWHYITRQLNSIFGYGRWSTTIKEVRYLGGDADNAPRGVMVVMQLTVEFPGLVDHDHVSYNRTTVFENTGYAPNKGGSWDMLEMATGAATATAFKRCATALGNQFGLSLYEKGGSDEEAPATTAAPRPAPASTASSSGGAPAYTGQEYFECADCGKHVQGYTAKTGKVYSTGDLFEMSVKQTGGLYCYNCKPRHSKR